MIIKNNFWITVIISPFVRTHEVAFVLVNNGILFMLKGYLQVVSECVALQQGSLRGNKLLEIKRYCLMILIVLFQTGM